MPLYKVGGLALSAVHMFVQEKRTGKSDIIIAVLGIELSIASAAIRWTLAVSEVLVKNVANELLTWVKLMMGVWASF